MFRIDKWLSLDSVVDDLNQVSNRLRLEKHRSGVAVVGGTTIMRRTSCSRF